MTNSDNNDFPNNQMPPLLSNQKDEQESLQQATENGDSQIHKKQVLDHLGDVFEKMTIGIWKFIFKFLPRKIYFYVRAFFKWLWKIFPNILRKIFTFARKIFRVFAWFVAWFISIFAVAFLFNRKWLINLYDSIVDFIFSFVPFIIEIYNYFVSCLNGIWRYIINYKVEIWFTLAIMGSIYGLLHITLKKRSRRKKESKQTIKQK